MFTNFPPGQYKIFPFTDGLPVGVERLIPPPLFQYLRPGLPCQTWQVDRAFVLCSYRYTGVKDGKVIVSKNPDDNVKWKIIPYNIAQNKYFITPADDPTKAWTLSSESDINPYIVIAEINPNAGPSNDQFFQVLQVNE
ncbi:hypothetical protein JVT61DRAFT_4930 [Boletus reticuloceps]|uniref:Uncharacterized protein n=1 Tax=Boletus reticuloceps TaxID=495285 RepID=A0A8I2Z0R0_9AGAM|nr:hypothetical protein JVT61DRAFT_4930 [Boletus reticuloceps]